MLRIAHFISYNGKFPNLCNGVLTLEINGKIITFSSSKDFEADYKFDLYSGGYAGTSMDFKKGILTEGPWELHLPSEFSEIEEDVQLQFNENVECGCCGGCLKC